MKTNKNTIALLLGIIAPLALSAADIDVYNDNSLTSFSTASLLGTNIRIITANQTWTNNNTYFLTDRVFIPNGVTLTIQPGTKIYGSIDTNNTSIKTDDKVGSLTATRGGKLIADGTATSPIIFSSVREWESLPGNGDSPFDVDAIDGPAPTLNDGGQWGGVILLGKAFVSVINSSGNNAKTAQIEGFAPAGSVSNDGETAGALPDATQYGESPAFPVDNADNSGIIRYVSIRHGGYEFSSAREINGLTLGGVGSGTIIDYVEVYANLDDGIEFFGGTVNTNHLVMAFNQDDSYDIDQGYKGTNQFWFGIQTPGIADAGGEWDGVDGTITGAGVTAATTLANQAKPIIYNGTFIGAGRSNTLTRLPSLAGKVNWEKGNFAMHIEDYFNGEIYNCVFDDYADDLVKFNDNALSYGTTMQFKSNTIGRFGSSPRVQMETSTVTGSATSSGNLSVTVAGTGAGTYPVALVSGDTTAQVAAKIAAELTLVSAINAAFTISVLPVEATTGVITQTIVFVNKTAGNNDSSFVVTIPAALGMTTTSSANTVAGGVAPIPNPAIDAANNASYVTGTEPAGGFFADAFGAPINGNSNGGTDPLLTTYTRDGNNNLTAINPIPAANSPLLNSGYSFGAPVSVSYRGAFGPEGNWAAGWTKLSESGVMTGTAPTPAIVDTDGDGISDALEATTALTDLGFSSSVNNVTPTNRFSSLYTSSSIQTLRGTSMMIGPVTAGGSTTLTLPLFKSSDLVNWTPFGNVTATVNTPAGKNFYRVDMSTNAPNP